MTEDFDSEFTADIAGEFRSGNHLSEKDHRKWVQSKLEECLYSAFAEFEVSNIEVKITGLDNKTTDESDIQ